MRHRTQTADDRRVQAALAPGPGPERTPLPIARLRHTQATRMWTLYRRDRHLRFHRYDQLEPSPDISDLLHEIDRDPIATFWG
jgi:hypothetical protein